MTARLPAAGLALLFALGATAAAAQEKFIGEITLYGYTFCPRGSLEANGQLLPISGNTALFSLYGTTFGGDGRTSFALPDLRGRAPIGNGRGPGLADRRLGTRGGSESVTLNTAQMPAHDHGVSVAINGTTAQGSSPTPAGNLPALSTAASVYAPSPTGTTLAPMSPEMASVSQSRQGGGQAVGTMPPFLAMRYCVNLFGVFPSRN